MSDAAWYCCERCDVRGRGPACWVCGSTRVTRKGTALDTFVYGTVERLDEG